MLTFSVCLLFWLAFAISLAAPNAYPNRTPKECPSPSSEKMPRGCAGSYKWLNRYEKKHPDETSLDYGIDRSYHRIEPPEPPTLDGSKCKLSIKGYDYERPLYVNTVYRNPPTVSRELDKVEIGKNASAIHVFDIPFDGGVSYKHCATVFTLPRRAWPFAQESFKIEQSNQYDELVKKNFTADAINSLQWNTTLPLLNVVPDVGSVFHTGVCQPGAKTVYRVSSTLTKTIWYQEKVIWARGDTDDPLPGLYVVPCEG